MDIVSLWDKTLQLIKGELSPPSFNAFFKQIKPLQIQSNTLILLVPNDFTKGILEDRYLNLIESSVNQLSLKKYNIQFVLNENEVKGLDKDHNIEEDNK
ncbi:MAG: DnaA N-terminal domain-containing protein, partial [Paeniclostridium sp.]